MQRLSFATGALLLLTSQRYRSVFKKPMKSLLK